MGRAFVEASTKLNQGATGSILGPLKRLGAATLAIELAIGLFVQPLHSPRVGLMNSPSSLAFCLRQVEVSPYLRSLFRLLFFLLLVVILLHQQRRSEN